MTACGLTLRFAGRSIYILADGLESTAAAGRRKERPAHTGTLVKNRTCRGFPFFWLQHFSLHCESNGIYVACSGWIHVM